MRSISKAVAALCLVLTFWSAIAVVAHHHNSTEAAKCTVCAAAHSAFPQPTSTLPNATVISETVFRVEPLARKQSFIAFALYVRPPPAV